ncbi:MAG: hypothetical protein HN366_19740 [Deltaproteobacteria bacterium]|jgi:hypothetical protein|nr:hypothetical protein [Deltaproteobacteria bacterium]
MKKILDKISPHEALEILKLLAKTDKQVKKKLGIKEMDTFLKKQCEDWSN